jgi:hypothetical protein
VQRILKKNETFQGFSTLQDKKSGAMHLNLSVSDIPYSAGDAAGCNLIILVTNVSSPNPVQGLTQQNFSVRWLSDDLRELTLSEFAVQEYNGTNNLPNIPGAYAVDVQTNDIAWSPLSSNVTTFVIRVEYDTQVGETLYKITDPPTGP